MTCRARVLCQYDEDGHGQQLVGLAEVAEDLGLVSRGRRRAIAMWELR